jgi:transcriptional regulator NrdR family protein
MDLQVQKKDGTLQPFDRSKVSAGAMRSGASIEEAENVTGQVEAWARSVAQNGVVNATELRAKVLEVLKTVNPVAGSAFETYQKPQVEPVASVVEPEAQPQV